MTNFKSDLKQETILSKYLDNIYIEKKLDFERIFDLHKQHQGIDVIITIKSNQYFIDEKAQLHYINSDLPTFIFELSYLKNGVFKQGWLFDKNKLTEYYFLITGIFLKKGKNKLSHPDDIDKIKITSVNRNKLIEHLSSIDLDKEKLLQYDSKLRKNNSFGKNNIPELNPKLEGLIYFTNHLNEKPINLQ
jgi:hypothetical protein